MQLTKIALFWWKNIGEFYQRRRKSEILIINSAYVLWRWAVLGTKGVNQQQSREQDRSAPARVERWALWHHAEQHDLQTALSWARAAQGCTARRVNPALKLLFPSPGLQQQQQSVSSVLTPCCFPVKVNARTVMQRSILRAAGRAKLSRVRSLICFLSVSAASPVQQSLP